MFLNINWLAVIIAIFANMILGAIWYSPILFGKTWQKLKEVSDEDLKNSPVWIMMIPFFGSVIMVLAFLSLVNLTQAKSFLDGLLLGFLVVLTSLSIGANHVVFGNQKDLNKRFKLFIIDYSYPLIGFCVVSIILSLFAF